MGFSWSYWTLYGKIIIIIVCERIELKLHEVTIQKENKEGAGEAS